MEVLIIKRFFVFLGVIIAFSLCTSQIAFAQSVADNLAKTAVIKSQNIDIAPIIDENIGTKLKISKKTQISFEIIEPIHSLYIVWDKPPVGAFITLQNGQTIALGENEFLHELLTLANKETSFTLTLESAILCEIYLFGEGELPQFVQAWQAPYADADMLVLPTHADDEHLFFGGTMPFYSHDKKVQIAYLNNHWGEPYRMHELLNGLWAVGITAYPIIPAFNDIFTNNLEHALTIYNEDEILQYQTKLIRRFKPEVIIAHDILGEYGHGTHMLNAYGVQKSILLAQDANAYTQSADEFGTFTVLKTYLHLWGENEIIMDWGTPLPQFNGKTALEMAVIGFAEHASQQKYFTVEATGAYDCRKFGLYNTNVGADIQKNDFFESITPEMYSDYIPPPVEVQSTVSPPQSKPQKPQSEPPKSENSKQINILLVLLLALLPIFFILIRKTRK